MNKSLQWLKKQAKNYSSLTDKEKHEFITQAYHKSNMSYAMIAEIVGTHSNKIRRDAIKLGIRSKSKSEAQRVALENERHPHPTKGQKRSEDVKIQISESMYDIWENMDEKEREDRRQKAIELWEQKTPEEIIEFRKAAGEGVRTAAKEGSALEKYLFKQLIAAGYEVQFHKEHFLLREKQQIDLFIPKLNVAIEVDGPSHFSNIWGDDVLRKNIERDKMKTGLLLEKGLCIIRVRQTKSLSAKYKRDILKAVILQLKNIEKSFPAKGERHKIIGDV